MAQGDNQVISTHFKLQKYRNEFELEANLRNTVRINEAIRSGIQRGTTKLLLTIDQSETMQSADFLCYGKVPVFRGVIYPLNKNMG